MPLFIVPPSRQINDFFTNGKRKTNELLARPAESQLVTLGLLLVEVESFSCWATSDRVDSDAAAICDGHGVVWHLLLSVLSFWLRVSIFLTQPPVD